VILWLLLALAAAAGLLAASYWGAGIILYPPNKLRLEAFPEQFGLRYEKISFKTKDGLTLKGWFIPSNSDPKEERTLLMCHGWGDNKGELLKITHFLNATGFNLLYFDHRSHGESEGKITTIGFLELIDLEAAITYLNDHHPEALKKLGVFGLSMGAAVAIMAMPRHPKIKAAVLESPFTDYRKVVRQWAWNNFKIPYFPLVALTLLWLRFRVGESGVDSYSPISYVSRISPRPLLIIGGGKDLLMPEADVRALYTAAREPKQLWIIPEATHALCHEVAGLEYEARVAGFFKKHL
jgi:alpha-beta hydrolase superfamily lysophospholipase